MSHTPGAAVVLILAVFGCSRPAPQVAPVAGQVAAIGGTPRPGFAVDGAQDRAQRAWCSYLDLLYRRSTQRDTPWAHRDACLGETSTASPAMLERTAACARKALERFDGDPLTAAYAAEVRRCGSEALDASALTAEELDPFLEAVCKRAAVCDATPYAECRSAISEHVATRLARAIGAVNDRSRARLRTCIAEAPCSSAMGERLSTCVEPIMDRLLWLPPSHEH